MKLFKRLIIAGIFSACAGIVFAEQEKAINPYAVTANKVTLAEPATLTIDPSAINMLSPNLGTFSAGIRPVVANYMILWSRAKTGPSQVEWTVEVPLDGTYVVTASVEGKGSRLAVTCNEQKWEREVTEPNWHRLELGDVPLKAGLNKVLLEIEAVTVKVGKKNKSFLLSGLELAKPAVREAIRKEALAMRQQADWFKDAGYGLMFQWTNRATPPEGPIKDWEEKVNDFNLDGFIKLVDESGAAYVVWSMTWGNQYISAPVKSLDAIIAGRTTTRDLLGEMADRLHKKGVKLILYYHYGYECYHSQDTDWLKAVGGYEADKTKLYTNLMSILSEVGNRYGNKLDGWWFDGGARYLNCHFDGSSANDGILTAPFKAFTEAARAGNPNRLVAYNSWIKPQITAYQDYYGGEGKTSFKPEELRNGVFNTGRQQELQAHGCFTLEKRWGHIDLDTPITKPKYDLKRLTGFVKQAQKNRYPLSINLEMYEDGSVSPESYALLKELKSAGSKQITFLQQGLKSSDEILTIKQEKAVGKKLGAIWFIGDSITQSNADGEGQGSPRKSLYDLLNTNGYSFTYTGHHARNVDGLPVTGATPADNLYHYHTGVSGILIGEMNPAPGAKKKGGVVPQLAKYWQSGRLATVKPSVILIMLGTNDVGHGFELDNAPARLRGLLDLIYALPNVGQPKVFLATIPPNRRNDSDRANVIIFNESVPRIVAEYQEKGREIYFVDQFKPIDDNYEANMRRDNLHPNGTGNNTMAKQWFDAIEKEIGKIASSDEASSVDDEPNAFPGKKTDFRGYDRYDRVKTAKGYMSVVCPKNAAPGKPWLWRSLYWNSIKKFNAADLQLVEQGYHVVLAHGDVSGHPKGNAAIDAAYELVTTEYGFSKKCSMASMSRGTLSLFRWATMNPEKVESILVDNGVCNVLSWPAGYNVPGNKTTSDGNAGSWADFKKKFGYATDAEALLTKESPIDLLEPLAKAGVPILMVCGSKDTAVPYAENDAIMEERYKKLGGSIKVIIEDKGHKHGMKDPTPVLEFIKKHTSVPLTK